MTNKFLTTIISIILLILVPVGANQVPTANAGPDQTVSADAVCTADVTLNGTGSNDPDGDPLTFTWTNSFGTTTGETPTVNLDQGSHEITLTVDDNSLGVELGDWNPTTNMPDERRFTGSFIHNDNVYVVGGGDATGGHHDTTISAPINTDGTIGTWTTDAETFTTARLAHTSVEYNDYLYILGGTVNGIQGFNDVQFTKIKTDGTLEPWQTTNSFATGRWTHTSFAHNGYIYIIGGASGTGGGTVRYSDVQYAQINANGSLGIWQTTTQMPENRNSHGSFVHNNKVYVIAGSTGGPAGTRTTKIMFAEINSNGTLGTWTETTSYPMPLDYFSVTLHNNVIYTGGGEDPSQNSIITDVMFYATINTDGTIGTWTQTESLTPGRRYHDLLSQNGFVYVLGGDAPLSSDVQYSEIEKGTSTDTTNVTVDDVTPPETFFTVTPPTITNSANANFEFDVIENCGTATFEESLDGAPFTPASSPRTLTALNEGMHTYRVRAVDSSTNVDPTPATYTWTIDTTPPIITDVTANPDTLWPPNHRMVQVGLTVSSDMCDLAPDCVITSVSSNEAENGLGDGDQAPDWEITGDLTLDLRAERSGLGNDRLYTVTVNCVDIAGNNAQSITTVTVPHNKA